jgi:tetratricopeptide (TPR) repeat protein
VANAEKANEQMEIARRNAKQAEINAKEAKGKHDKAVTQMVNFVKYVHNRMVNKKGPAGASPELMQLRTDMLSRLRLSLLAVAHEMDKNWISTFGEVRTYQQMGDLMKQLGQGGEALRLYRQGYETSRKVSEEQPDNDTARGNMGLMRLAEGDILLELDGDGLAALASYKAGRDLHQEILVHRRSPDYTDLEIKKLLAFGDCRLSKASLSLGDPTAARRYLQECRAYRSEWTKAEPTNGNAWGYLAEAHLWLATAAWHLGDRKRMEEHFGESLRICEDLARQNPRDFSLRSDLAEIYGMRGDAQLRLGNPAEAEKDYRRALQHMQAVVTRDPDDISQLPLLAQTHERLGGLAVRQGNRAEAAKQYEPALQLRGELLRIGPNNLAWQINRALALARCGKHAEAIPEADKLRQRAARSPELLLQLARCYADCAALDTPQKRPCTAKALEAVQAATQKEYRDAIALETDPELELLRPEPAYKTLLATVKAR